MSIKLTLIAESCAGELVGDTEAAISSLAKHPNDAKSDELAKRDKAMFYDNEVDALRNLGRDFRKIEFKKGNTLEAGITNPLEGKYAINEIADALEETAAQTRSKYRDWETDMQVER